MWLPSRLPIANASLILNWVGEDVWPLPISQAGMFTHESRGIDITSAHCRSAGMWMTISVSDWSVTRPVPYAALSPSPGVGPDDDDVLGLRMRVHRLRAEQAADVVLLDVRVEVVQDLVPGRGDPDQQQGQEPAPKAMIFRRGQCRSQCPSDRPAFWSMRRHTRPN